MMSKPNPPDSGEPSERLFEIAEILAAGLTRLFGAKSSPISSDTGECLLHLMPNQSGDVHTYSAEGFP